MTLNREADARDVSELFHLMILMTRLSTRLSALPQFQKAGLGLAEWLALSVLREEDGISNKDLAKKLSVSGQRANQIRSSLEDEKLIAVTQSPDDHRRNVIRLTDHGLAKLLMVNNELQALISAGTAARPTALARATKGMRFLTRLIYTKSPVFESVDAVSSGK